MSNRVFKADQIKLIMECRKSGLSDYQWCEQNGIHAGTFYNWVSKLKKSGYTFPEPAKKVTAQSNIQDVVKVGLIESSISEIEQNVSQPEIPNQGNIAAEIQVGNITLRLFNGADKHLIQNTLNALGGMNHAW